MLLHDLAPCCCSHRTPQREPTRLPAVGLIAVLGAGLGNLFFSAPLPFRVSLPAIGIWTALVVLGAVLATDTAATRASRLTVREALAYL
jgi:putative ABC transport system permease protein